MTFGKLGGTECNNLIRIHLEKKILWTKDLEVNAGVFPLDVDTVKKWVFEYIESIKDLDLIVQWQMDPAIDETLISLYNPTCFLQKEIDDLLPTHLGKDGWHYYLERKKILVIHPMVNTISLQLEKYSKIWPGAKIGDFTCIKCPYQPSVSGKSEFGSFFDVLEHLIAEISNRTFDFAIVGAGAYSLLLLKFIKSLQKPAIHLGGRTQLMFGIRGNRWDKETSNQWKIENFYNSSSYWVSPLREDVPINSVLVEGGCYW
jgi:hypothetical protein